jgi:hypothetical protein
MSYDDYNLKFSNLIAIYYDFEKAIKEFNNLKEDYRDDAELRIEKSDEFFTPMQTYLKKH